MDRRNFLRSSGAGLLTAGLAMSGPVTAAPRPATTMKNNAPEISPEDLLKSVPDRMFDFSRTVNRPVILQSLDLLERDGAYFVRVASSDGVTATVVANERVEYLWPILQQRVAPHFLGQDARDIEERQRVAYLADSNYKLVGLPFWCCIGYVDFALLELMGQTARKPVGELLGPVVKREFSAYLSSTRRDTTAEDEVAWITPLIASTKATAVKVKIGGRMSRNADAYPGRTEKLVELARKTWGDRMTIYVDSNGSYDAKKAIEVGRMLESYGVAFYEEPCPFEDYADTKRVAQALKIPIACGEQDSSLPRFAEMLAGRTIDIVQPDMNYCGGILRACRIAKMAETVGIPVIPHSPQPMPQAAYVLQFASRTPNFGPHFEYPARQPKNPPVWGRPLLNVQNGIVPVPTGPGFGIQIDPDFLKGAKTLFTLAK